MRAFTWVCALVLFSGCSSPAPILYPNAQYKRVGRDAADNDVAACREMAEQAGANQQTNGAGQVATGTAVGAGAGAASGAVGGAISGAVGRGSMIGAASGAVWGFLSSLFRSGRSQPSHVYVQFVNRCLSERGYEVSGWQ